MDFRTYVTALRRHWWVAALAVLLGVVASLAAYAASPATYASTVTFYVSAPVQNGANPQSVGEFAQSRVNSYVVLMSSEQVARGVITSTGVDLSPREVARKVTAEANLNTVVVRATVRDSSSQRSMLLAQGLAATFATTASQLDNPAGGRPTVYVNVVSGPTALGVVAPSLKVYGGLGVLAGGTIGVLLILLLEILDSTVRNVETATALAGAPLVGDIGLDTRARKAPLILTKRTGSLRAESFRQLRTNLQFIHAARSVKVLVVTSATSGEGKTSVCINLALALAEAGRKVLVLDGDLRRPRLADLLELESEVGLTSVLIGQVAPEQALQPWLPNLTVLTSGPLPPNPSELLGGERMAALVDRLRPQFDDILIDTPPLLPVTDAAVAASLADGVLLVVRYAKTTREQVKSAVGLLRGVSAETVGVVINMRRAPRRERRGYGSAPGFTWDGGAHLHDATSSSAGEQEPAAPVQDRHFQTLERH